jgi:hypothetical protein
MLQNARSLRALRFLAITQKGNVLFPSKIGFSAGFVNVLAYLGNSA